MFERFTDKGRKIIILAREEAERHQITWAPSTWCWPSFARRMGLR